ncbi:TonB-dependent receptor [Chitinophaga lutea]|uniref:TonB-dependent receptor n=1 Tax=Chitinophaga lutea TaxID=2488634 RepID=A0A3N4Q392_9BACT|nr:TonB-dependent receptor [Chitinophaga lutea]RPE14045.1 TonB-dependent receptor [Chitinophaga lutea]
MLRSFPILILFTFIPLLMQAQSTVSGKVTNAKKKPLPGVNIAIAGTYDGATTAADGSFSFTTSAKGERVVTASLAGYAPLEIKTDLAAAQGLNLVLKETVNELKMVTISAGSFEASDEKKNTVLKPLDIVTTAGANADIVSALKTLPGAQQVGEKEGLFVRGGTGYETQTFIDGMLVRNPFSSGMPDYAARGRFSPFLFKGTTFSSGGYSAQYGQGLSSALVLESTDLPDRSSYSLGLGTVGPSVGVDMLSKNKKQAYGFEVDYFNLAPYFALVKQKQKPTIAPQGANASANYRLKTSRNGMLKIFVNSSWSKFGFRGESLEYPGFNEEFELENKYLYTNISYKESLGKGWKLNLGTSFSTNQDRIYMDTVGKSPSPSRVNARQDLTQFRVMVTRMLGRFSMLRLGTEYQYADERNKFNSFRGSYVDSYSGSFAEADIYFTPRFVGRLGTRYEYTSLLKAANIAPRASLAYKLDDKSQVAFAYGEFYQKPEQQYLRMSHNLGFMRATHYIASYQRLSEFYTLRGEVFYKKYHDLVKTVPHLNNNGTGYAKGAELFWRDRKSIKNVDYWLSYSFLDTKRDYLNYPYEVQPDFAAQHTATLVYKHYIPSIQLNVGATYSFATGRPYYNPNRPESEFMKDRTRNLNTLSLNVNYLTSIGKAFTVFVFTMSNVLGNDQEYGFRYSSDKLRRNMVGPMAPRFFFVGMFMSFGIDRRQEVIDRQ